MPSGGCTFANPCPNLNATQLTDYFVYANTVTGDAFGFVMIIVIFIIAFFTMRNFPFKQSLPTALFVTAIIALLMRLINLTSDWVVFLLFASAVAATILLTMGKDD